MSVYLCIWHEVSLHKVWHHSMSLLWQNIHYNKKISSTLHEKSQGAGECDNDKLYNDDITQVPQDRSNDDVVDKKAAANDRWVCVPIVLPVYFSNFFSIRDVAAMVVNDIISVANDEVLTTRRERYKYVAVISNEAMDIVPYSHFERLISAV